MRRGNDDAQKRLREAGAEVKVRGDLLRHARGCRSRKAGRCSCAPSFQAQVWSARENKTIRKTFQTLDDARGWRHESQIALRKGMLRSSSQTTLNEVAEDWLVAAEAGIVRTRIGEAYKPSAVRAYRQALNHRALPLLGTSRLTAISHTMLQDLPTGSPRKGFRPAASATRSCRCARSSDALTVAAMSPSTRRSTSPSPSCEARESGSRRRRKSRRSSTPSKPTTARSSPLPSTPDCGSANCKRCNGTTSTSTPT